MDVSLKGMEELLSELGRLNKNLEDLKEKVTFVEGIYEKIKSSVEKKENSPLLSVIKGIFKQSTEQKT